MYTPRSSSVTTLPRPLDGRLAGLEPRDDRAPAPRAPAPRAAAGEGRPNDRREGGEAAGYGVSPWDWLTPAS
jgi:hypothetical protein